MANPNIMSDRKRNKIVHRSVCLFQTSVGDIYMDVRRCQHGYIQMCYRHSGWVDISHSGWVDISPWFQTIRYFKAKRALESELD